MACAIFKKTWNQTLLRYLVSLYILISDRISILKFRMITYSFRICIRIYILDWIKNLSGVLVSSRKTIRMLFQQQFVKRLGNQQDYIEIEPFTISNSEILRVTYEILTLNCCSINLQKFNSRCSAYFSVEAGTWFWTDQP